jgi:hypothetical protein
LRFEVSKSISTRVEIEHIYYIKFSLFSMQKCHYFTNNNC